jgi:hypothetical protein
MNESRKRKMPRKTNKVVNKCAINACEREAKYVESGLCDTCYAGMYYWKNKTPTQILRRQKQLAVLEERMELMGGNRR